MSMSMSMSISIRISISILFGQGVSTSLGDLVLFHKTRFPPMVVRHVDQWTLDAQDCVHSPKAYS